ncbi:hypothetical protein H0H87_000777 [Tephrocybe sp. NHM501043]|nr:hypothetical protein H0H87_000777 [Tephrocybe sp. NHM501043]
MRRLSITEDHANVPYTAALKPGLDTWTKMADPAFVHEQTELFKATGTGTLVAGIPSVYAFLPFKDFDKDGSIAKLASEISLPKTPAFNLQKEWIRNDKIPFLELISQDRFKPGTLAAPVPGVDYITSFLILLHAFNHGSVHILSKEPDAAPAIEHNYLDNELDMKILIEGYKLMRKIYSSEPLRDLIAEEVSPGPAIQTDEALAEYIKKVLESTCHPIGTASMLPREDQGVVNARLKVYGTKNLRVVRDIFSLTNSLKARGNQVDASIIPINIAAHIQATMYAVAEKAADIIKEDYVHE